MTAKACVDIGQCVTLDLPNGQSINATVTAITEPKPRRNISVGQRYMGPSNTEYLLAATGPTRSTPGGVQICVNFIALQDGTRWTEPQPVVYTRNITDEEFRRLCGTGTFHLIGTLS